MPNIAPGVIAQRRGLSGTAIDQGGTITLGIVATSSGKATAVTNEIVTRGAGNTDTLANIPVLSVELVGNTTGQQDYIQDLDYTLSGNTLDWSQARPIEAPTLESPQAQAGGSFAAATYYWKMTVIDKSGNESTGSATVSAAVTLNQEVALRWGAVVNAAAYRIYRNTADSGWGTGSLLVAEIPVASQELYVDEGASLLSGNVPTTNSTSNAPGSSTGSTYYVNYTYSDTSIASIGTTPKRYFDMAEVRADHGVGSDFTNAARMILSPAGQGASSFIGIAPSSGDTAGWIAALATLETQDVQMVVQCTNDETLDSYLVNHVTNMSDTINQKWRYGMLSLPQGASIGDTATAGTILYKLQQLKGNRRISTVLPDGGTIYADTWEQTDGTYLATQAKDGWVAAVAAAAKISALNDPAEPLTNKSVVGLGTSTSALYTNAQRELLRSNGGLILQNKNGIMTVVHGLTMATDIIENQELSIGLAEDEMARRLLAGTSAFIGRKLTSELLTAVRGYTEQILETAVGDVLLGGWDRGSLSVAQDASDTTQINIGFNYDPIYPTNKLVFSWSFSVARLTA